MSKLPGRKSRRCHPKKKRRRAKKEGRKKRQRESRGRKEKRRKRTERKIAGIDCQHAIRLFARKRWKIRPPVRFHTHILTHALDALLTTTGARESACYNRRRVCIYIRTYTQRRRRSRARFHGRGEILYSRDVRVLNWYCAAAVQQRNVIDIQRQLPRVRSRYSSSSSSSSASPRGSLVAAATRMHAYLGE